MKPLQIDINKITFRKAAAYRKAMRETALIEDEMDQVEAQAKLMADLADNWTVDDFLDLPVTEFPEVARQIDAALRGILPNKQGSGTAS